MKSDPKDAQMWSFCAAAAIGKSSFNADAYETYVAKIVASLKQIMVTPDKCPCEDAIPATFWRRY